MITEDYVSYEVAKLLKEKGFKESTRLVWYEHLPSPNAVYNSEIGKPKRDYFYWEKDGERNSPWTNNSPVPSYINGEVYSCPTHQMAMKYLREVHQLHISVDAKPIYGKVKDEKGRNTCGLLYWHYMASGEWMNDKYNPQQKAFVVSEKSYENAVEAALKYSLENLI